LKNDSITSYQFHLGLLNSKLIGFWYRNNTVPKAGGYFAYKTQFMKNIPIPHDSEFELIASIVYKILTEKISNPENDTTALEAEIDQLVYDLYGLTDEEIAIVEKSVG
jgi:hypothetical protein